MAKYKKKPVVIEAFKFGVDNIPDWFMDKVSDNTVTLNYMGKLYPQKGYCEIKTLEGVMICNVGDYIIRGVQGELYPCKSDIFNKTYEEID